MISSFESEPNGTRSTADTITIGSAFTGFLSTSSDVDWYSFNVNGPGFVSLSFDAPTNDSFNSYFNVGLYDSSGEFLRGWGLGKDYSSLTLGPVPAAGTYHFKIDKGTYFSANDYSATIEFNSSTLAVYESEPNDTQSTADTITIGSAFTGFLSTSSDVDWYSFNVNGPGFVSLSFDAPTNDSFNSYFNVGLYDSSGEFLRGWGLGKDYSSLTLGPVPAAGTYHFKIDKGTYFSANDYSATIEFTSDTSSLSPTFILNASTSGVNEGSSASFTLSTTNVAAGTALSYVISGVQDADIVGGQLTGSVAVNAQGRATISVPVMADNLTEGPETMTITVRSAQGADLATASVTINDISLSPVLNPSYSLSAAASSVNEGSSASFTLSTTNVAAGTALSYVISGVQAADIVGGQLSGTVTVGNNGQATISIPIAADNVTEGTEILTVTAQGKSASVSIVDTSLTPTPTRTPTPTPALARVNTLADESFEPVAGESRFVVGGELDAFTIRSTDAGKTWQLTSPVTGTDTLTGFKRVTFEDKTVALDFAPQESGYESAMLIGAAFGKDFVPAYFSAGLSLFDLGRDMSYVCDLIAGAGLIEAQIGDSTDSAWVKHVYKNVVGVEPDALTELVLIDFLASGQFTRSSLLAAAAELPLLEAQVDIAGLQATGLAYTPFI
jgi:hypothetical protein